MSLRSNSILFFVFLFSIVLDSEAQSFQQKDLELVEDHHDPLHRSSKRGLVRFEDASPFIRYNPVVVLSQGLLYLYQNKISQQLSAECLYHPSCSDFTKRSIKSYGAVKGVFLGADRLTRCTGIADKGNEHKALEKGKLRDLPSKYRWPE